MTQDIQITRRGALQGAAVAAVALFAGGGASVSSAVAVPLGASRARFLRPEELRTLEAVVDRIIPGVPEDTVPGAVAAGCHEAIDALLGAFTVSPPRIYAGGPFSDRGGSPANHFERFLSLDEYESKAWRLRIEGSGGRRSLERNGPVKGYQRTYGEGLVALEGSVPGGFSNAPGPVRDLALERNDDPVVQEMLDLAVPHTIEFLYGAPEYGGNRELLGWRTTDFEGDTQPRGYTREQVVSPESSGPLDLVEDIVGGRSADGAGAGLDRAAPRGAGALGRTAQRAPRGGGAARDPPARGCSADRTDALHGGGARPGRAPAGDPMSGEAVVVGSGAAGTAAAWELARHGWDVTILERGRNLRPGLGEVPSGGLHTEYGSDEIKGTRQFGFPDPLLEPYTTRTQAEAANGVARSAQGALGQLGAAVGGTSLHYNAKTPRLWKQDFTQLSDHGPVEGAQVADWPISYDDLEPFYDTVEYQVGVQGDRSKIPHRTLEQSPRRRDFVMPPNPTGHAATLLAEGASRLGFEAYPYPAAVNSRPFDGRPACNSCGMCSGFGCTINARGDALVSWLNPAMRTGRVRVLDRAYAYRIETTGDGRRARAVHWADVHRRRHRLPASTVVLAGSPINTARLLLLSASSVHPDGLGNRSDQVGRNMMFHNFTLAAALYPHDVKPLRAQSTTLQVDDLVGPFTGPEVTALGVPYIRGGIVQVGSAIPPVGGATMLAGLVGYGNRLKQLMKAGILHQRTAGSQLIHQDLPQAENRVDLDPRCVISSASRPLGSPTARTSTRRRRRSTSVPTCRRCTSSRREQSPRRHCRCRC